MCLVVCRNVALDLWRDQDLGHGAGKRPAAGIRGVGGREGPVHGLEGDTGKEDVVIDERILGRLEVVLDGNGGRGR